MKTFNKAAHRHEVWHANDMAAFFAGLFSLILIAVLLFAPAQTSHAATNNKCDHHQIDHITLPADTELKILGNDFPALHGLTKAVEHCSDKYKISAELTQSYRELQLPALQSSPANFDIVLTGNNAIVPLMNEGLLQPLDKLIEQYAPNLPKSNRVTFNGKTMAIAALANAQHMYVREDMLNSVNAAPPVTLTDVISLCGKLQDETGLRYPLVASFKAGWDLGLEFINHYLATGGNFTEGNGASVNNPAGLDALNNLKAMTACMNPDYLSQGTNEIQALWQSGNAAIAFLWGSRAGSILNSTDTLPIVRSQTRLLNAPLIQAADNPESLKPASTLWWVGFAIPQNLTQDRAAAGFVAMLRGLYSGYLLENHKEDAVWLLEDFKPDSSATGVQQVVDGGAPAYPSDVFIGLLHHAAGEQIPAFFQGRLNAEQTLQAIDAWVATSAKEKGFSK